MPAGSRSAGTIRRFHARFRSPAKRAGGNNTSTTCSKRSRAFREPGAERLEHGEIAENTEKATVEQNQSLHDEKARIRWAQGGHAPNAFLRVLRYFSVSSVSIS